MFSRRHRIAFIASTLILSISACRETTMPEVTTDPAFGRNSGKGGSAPTAPKNLTATAVGPYSVSLSWEPSTSSSSSFEYRVRINQGSFEYRVPSTQTSFNWKDALYPGINYEFWVYAIDASGNKSANSYIVRVSTPADNQAPTAPALSASQVGHSYVTLNWTSIDESRLFYQIRQDGVQILRGSYSGGFTEKTSGTAIFLQPSTTYTFTAVARDFVGNLSQTSQLVVTTKARDPNEVDNVDPQAAIMYEIFLNGVRDDVQVGRGQSTVYGVVGENKLTVIAIDANGNRSAPTSFTLFLE
jgi:chitinase